MNTVPMNTLPTVNVAPDSPPVVLIPPAPTARLYGRRAAPSGAVPQVLSGSLSVKQKIGPTAASPMLPPNFTGWPDVLTRAMRALRRRAWRRSCHVTCPWEETRLTV